MIDQNDEKKIRTFTGKRHQGGKIQHEFIDTAGIFWIYPKARAKDFIGAVIGRTYDLTNGIPRIWEEIGKHQDEQEILNWQVENRVAMEIQKQKAVKSSPELEDIIERLKSENQHMSPAGRAAFNSWFMGRIQ